MTSSMTLNQHKMDNDVIVASLKSESACKLINRIPGLRLLISSLPGSASRTLVESLIRLNYVLAHVTTGGVIVCVGAILKGSICLLQHIMTEKWVLC